MSTPETSIYHVATHHSKLLQHIVQCNHKSLDSISSNCNQAGSEYDGADASTSSESCDHEHKLTQVCVDRVLQDVSELCTIIIVELGQISSGISWC